MSLASSLAAKRRNRLLIVRYKLFVGCQGCGYRRSHWALDYHHRPGVERLFSLNAAWKSHGRRRIKAEIRKCVVLCRNCHAEHHEENGSAPDVLRPS